MDPLVAGNVAASVLVFMWLNLYGGSTASRRAIYLLSFLVLILVDTLVLLTSYDEPFEGLFRALLALIGPQAMLLGWRAQLRWEDVGGDPDAREEAGLPQLGGRSRRYWNTWLRLSPFHVQRYLRLDKEERQRQHSMVERSVWEGRLGMSRSGEYRGMFVEVEIDDSESGWHIYLLPSDPRRGPVPSGWDIWADTMEDLEEWLGPSSLDVQWID